MGWIRVWCLVRFRMKLWFGFMLGFGFRLRVGLILRSEITVACE